VLAAAAAQLAAKAGTELGGQVAVVVPAALAVAPACCIAAWMPGLLMADVAVSQSGGVHHSLYADAGVVTASAAALLAGAAAVAAVVTAAGAPWWDLGANRLVGPQVALTWPVLVSTRGVLCLSWQCAELLGICSCC
jgi:hypothetical protein